MTAAEKIRNGPLLRKSLSVLIVPWFSAMAVNSSEECQSVHTVLVLPDGGVTNMQYEPPLNISSLGIPKMMKLNSESILHNHNKLEGDKANSYAPCILDVDIEKGKVELPKFNEESLANLKPDDSLARALPRQICLQVGRKFMQLLMNHGTGLPKFISRDKFVGDRVHDTPTNRSRKYKRSASFNSRRVVLLFSLLSSLGTTILIYLTLRVTQISDASGRFQSKINLACSN